MMYAEAITSFLESFGYPVYTSSTVPEKGVQFPYLTYEPIQGLDNMSVEMNVNVWHRTESEAAINNIVEKLAAEIKKDGIIIPCDESAIWIKKGNPWSQALANEPDRMIKRRILNIEIEKI